MPTAKPRLAITLEPEQHEVLARLAALQGRPMSRVVAELVAEFTPILARLVGTMEAAANAQASVRANIRRAVDDAESSILPHAEAVLQQYERFEGDLRQLALQIGEATERIESSASDAGRGDAPAAAGAGAGAGLRSAGEDPRPVITGVREGKRKAKGDSRKRPVQGGKASRRAP